MIIKLPILLVLWPAQIHRKKVSAPVMAESVSTRPAMMTDEELDTLLSEAELQRLTKALFSLNKHEKKQQELEDDDTKSPFLGKEKGKASTCIHLRPPTRIVSVKVNARLDKFKKLNKI
jgi:hypothetical protein